MKARGWGPSRSVTLLVAEAAVKIAKIDKEKLAS